MFPASVDHIWDMLSVLTNLDDALGGMGYCWIWASTILFESKLTQVSVSLSKPHYIPSNVEEG